jgi:arylsulfatase A-like enzyme
MSWLDPNTVPTMGNWFRAAGYRTYYKGKWHICHADIEVPGKHDSLMTTMDDGTPIAENVDFYQAADRLNDFGFSGWIGPEPHGASKANSGWIRDPGYAHQGLSQIDELEAGNDDQPWLLVNSFVNPHDIVFFGAFWSAPPPGFGLPYPTPEEVPQIPPPPTANEDLSTKPTAQASYVATYPQMFLPQPTIELYRRFYEGVPASQDVTLLREHDRRLHDRSRRHARRARRHASEVVQRVRGDDPRSADHHQPAVRQHTAQ